MTVSASRTAGLRISTVEGITELTVAGAVFDCDGLLVDSESIWLRMLAQWLGAQNVTANVSPQQFLGLSVDDTAAELSDHISHGQSVGAIVEDLTLRYSAMLADGVSSMPGALNLLTSLTDQIPLAVASNGLRDDVTSMLRHAGLLPAAHTVCTVDDVEVAKPAPDLYLTACHRLSIVPELAVAFEDSPAGARAALAAGLTVVGVNPDADVELPAHFRLNDLTQVSICPTGRAGHPNLIQT